MLRRSTYFVPPEEESSSEEKTSPLQKVVYDTHNKTDYCDLRPLEKMEVDSIANKTSSLETGKVS